MKLWDKGKNTNKLVESFTIGKDRELDLRLAKFDILGTMAHITMLESVKLLTKPELNSLLVELKNINYKIEKGNFAIQEGVEDVHSQVELMLTKKLGDIGKKVHSGRSRNDQVLVDIKLYLRAEVQEVVELTKQLFTTLQTLSEQYKEVLIPGYTHLQIAMPSSFGLWFGAYAESLVDDLNMLYASFTSINQNPLGSAAGYGSSFPLNRQLTTELLGFSDLSYNVIYAQMGRGKTEQNTAFGLASLASTLSKMAMDMCLYNSQNFGFVKFPDEFTTGSSIMPHKKNPDVWELVRGESNKIKALPNDIMMLTSNLPSGYHRDLQLLKEQIIPAIENVKDCLRISDLMLSEIIVNTEIIDDEKYKYIFSVEEVNKLVLQGTPFRDAYKQVGQKINNNNFKPDTHINHSHEGSIGNLCAKEINKKFDQAYKQFSFDSINKALALLIKE